MQSYSIWKARSQNDYSKEDNSVVRIAKLTKTYTQTCTLRDFKAPRLWVERTEKLLVIEYV